MSEDEEVLLNKKEMEKALQKQIESDAKQSYIQKLESAKILLQEIHHSLANAKILEALDMHLEGLSAIQDKLQNPEAKGSLLSKDNQLQKLQKEVNAINQKLDKIALASSQPDKN
ncbi:uncharacterized protein ATNIH1004_001840 [Aspergillus tanneri]|uniref:Uncharacterized protein n=1 Tax=Aspergillus tanneri TaxID=1220188 RepID=A0A5M9N0K8_9EURO|nr:uncharacterized protein ATNIH1004_001840 [Aspergillus tanneri]KAA8652931.1 hypothetical protein ATNIH1004_001840 [Aspergillus tanneri]